MTWSGSQPCLAAGDRAHARLDQHCRCVRDYKRLLEHHEIMARIAMVMTMSRWLARTQNW
jgi:hypothetical protein